MPPARVAAVTPRRSPRHAVCLRPAPRSPAFTFGLTVLVLAAALPSASTASLLAERYGADNGRVTRAVVLSTALAFITFSLLAWLADISAR